MARKGEDHFAGLMRAFAHHDNLEHSFNARPDNSFSARLDRLHQLIPRVLVGGPT